MTSSNESKTPDVERVFLVGMSLVFVVAFVLLNVIWTAPFWGLVDALVCGWRMLTDLGLRNAVATLLGLAVLVLSGGLAFAYRAAKGSLFAIKAGNMLMWLVIPLVWLAFPLLVADANDPTESLARAGPCWFLVALIVGVVIDDVPNSVSKFVLFMTGTLCVLMAIVAGMSGTAVLATTSILIAVCIVVVISTLSLAKTVHAREAQL